MTRSHLEELTGTVLSLDLSDHHPEIIKCQVVIKQYIHRILTTVKSCPLPSYSEHSLANTLVILHWLLINPARLSAHLSSKKKVVLCAIRVNR